MEQILIVVLVDGAIEPWSCWWSAGAAHFTWTSRVPPPFSKTIFPKKVCKHFETYTHYPKRYNIFKHTTGNTNHRFVTPTCVISSFLPHFCLIVIKQIQMWRQTTIFSTYPNVTIRVGWEYCLMILVFTYCLCSSNFYYSYSYASYYSK